MSAVSLFGAIALLASIAGCRKSQSPAGGTPVTRADVERIFKATAARSTTEQKLNSHFKDKGVTFDLAICAGGKDPVSEIGRGGSLLVCRGVKSGAQAIGLEREVRQLLSAEELEGMEITFEMGRYEERGMIGSASQFAEFCAEREEEERADRLIREGVGIDFALLEQKFEIGGKRHEMVQYGVNAKGEVVYLAVAYGLSVSPLCIAHRTDSSGRKSVRAKLKIGTETLDPPDVARNAVFCTETKVTRTALGQFTEPGLLEWLKSADEITPESLKAYHAGRVPNR